MWNTRDFLDLIILTTLNHSPSVQEGLTGYSLAKQIEVNFPQISVPSPGTLYFRLKKLNEGKLVEPIAENRFRITPKGIQYITKRIPETLDKSFMIWPSFIQKFIICLPLRIRIDYMERFQRIRSHPSLNQWMDADSPENFSIEQLEDIKNRLTVLRKHIEDQRNKQIQEIDETLTTIDTKISEEKSKWKKPDIIWE
jgi:DNA-binding PadR family transcriptional regulator